MKDEAEARTRRDVLMAGIGAAAGVASAKARVPAKFRVAVTGDFENLAAVSSPAVAG